MLLVETCTSLDEARTAVRTAALLRPEVLAVTAHFRADETMPDGTTPEEFVRAVVCDGAQIVGANCGDRPESYVAITNRMKGVTSKPLLVQPSAGVPERDSDGKWNYPVDAQCFVNISTQLVQAGANIVGGCCGISRVHIAAVCAQFRLAGTR